MCDFFMDSFGENSLLNLSCIRIFHSEDVQIDHPDCEVSEATELYESYYWVVMFWIGTQKVACIEKAGGHLQR